MALPVLGCPILNRPELLDAMLVSVDHPVGRLFIVDNGDVLPAQMEVEYGQPECAAAQEVHIVRPGCNLGVAESWNLIIRANLHAPWWCLANVDIEFGAGDLERLAATMDEASGPLCATICAFGAFAVNAAAIETVGWFDPGFSPIYFEDSDWQRRALLLKVPQVNIPSGTVHGGSASHVGEVFLARRNGETLYANRERYMAKWGGDGRPGEETYKTPWMTGQSPATVMLPPLSLLRAQSWDAQ